MLLANQGFANDARSAASGKGMPGIRVIAEPVACESTVAADIESGIDSVLDEIVDALTKPLTPQEKSPKVETADHDDVKGSGIGRKFHHIALLNRDGEGFVQYEFPQLFHCGVGDVPCKGLQSMLRQKYGIASSAAGQIKRPAGLRQ